MKVAIPPLKYVSTLGAGRSMSSLHSAEPKESCDGDLHDKIHLKFPHLELFM